MREIRRTSPWIRIKVYEKNEIILVLIYFYVPEPDPDEPVLRHRTRIAPRKLQDTLYYVPPNPVPKRKYTRKAIQSPVTVPSDVSESVPVINS